MGPRKLCVLAVIVLLTASCERAFDDASGGISNAGGTGVERAVPGDGPRGGSTRPSPDDGHHGEIPPPTIPPPTPTGESSTGAKLTFAERGRDGERGLLDGAEMDHPFSARIRIEDPTIVPVRVTWLVDGHVFRDDDLDAPYTIRYDGRRLPLGQVFRSDQGLPGEFLLMAGSSHEITAIIHQAGPDLTVTARFSVVGTDGSADAPASATTTTIAAPTTTADAAAPTTTTTAPTTTMPPPTTVPSSADGWPVPGPVAGRATVTGTGTWVVDYRDHGTPWHIHDVDIIANGGNGVGPAEAMGGGVMENSSVVVNDGADNIKIATDGTYRNLYLRMSTTGGHLDAMQSQGNSGFVIDNVVIEIPAPSQSVTGAVIIENLRGGGAGYRDVVGTVNRLKLIGTGPYHHDIRLQNNPAATMTMTFTEIDWSDAHPDSVLLLKGTPETLTVYVDDSVPDSRIKGAENATIIRI